MIKGDKYYILKEFAVFMFEIAEDMSKPVTISDTIEVTGILYIKFTTASGQVFGFISSYIFEYMLDFADMWSRWAMRMWMNNSLPPH
jgi:hypothetical protein